MIDIKYLLEHRELVARNNELRGAKIDLSLAVDASAERGRLIGLVEELRAQANDVAAKIPKAGPDERAGLVEVGRGLKEQVKKLEGELVLAEETLGIELRKYPNLLREGVPEGKDGDDNVVVRTFMEPTVFDFEPKDHLELGEKLGLIDMERAAKVAGSRFTYVLGDAVRLEFALVQYAMETLGEAGFTPVIPPHIVSTKAMAAMGYLEHGGEEEIYHLKHDDAVLIGTSEQAIGPMLMDEMLEEKTLPLRYMGFSPCYRREAGSFGRDVRGILRVHQFDKIEMFSFTTPEESDKEHESLLSFEEKLMQGLKLPYRVMALCSGDIGRPSARTYDIETWIPSQKTYRETHSTSNTTDYQTRRLNVRVKRTDGRKELAHALNGTAFAIGRTLIAILENYQRADGSIEVPEVLRKWVGKDVIG
jgi:seryl-tRNA synthetase